MRLLFESFHIYGVTTSAHTQNIYNVYADEHTEIFMADISSIAYYTQLLIIK